eukprot:7670519-Pyramimonas_sp.AAC.1
MSYSRLFWSVPPTRRTPGANMRVRRSRRVSVRFRPSLRAHTSMSTLVRRSGFGNTTSGLDVSM